MVYVWQVDELRRRADTQVLAASLARAVGADVEPPDVDAALAEFDAALTAEPRGMDPDEYTLRGALGLRR